MISYRFGDRDQKGWNFIILIKIRIRIVTAPTIVSVILIYFVVSRPKPTKVLINIAPWFLVGVINGLLPKLYGIFVPGYQILPESGKIGSDPLLTAFLNLIYTLVVRFLNNVATNNKFEILISKSETISNF
ncbi:MAG: hypothetical protein A2161_06250 [Candidatus Schekmanbacteria bacterium RBG_13_48_7]|uniref:Uncharacterized protein n=1 Tax=Candidatus Schekmanbacteria bacterium RBG_13_48_7 TaxID=1817878 RepID=A0A1F7RUX9_9BACT|nr:MAG: hypothetical protein A2161_06250 [Candidatus Schekmanbacteria bacterium RBG_13_48_7]